MRLSRSVIALFSLLAAGLPALAASNSADAPHVHVQLIVLPDELSRGGTADAGLYFKIEPGWHVYWKNAGDAGEPPRIHWTLPDGITAGDLEFPTPKRLPLGPLMDFGYENEVLFPFTLQVAQTAKQGPAPLQAKVSWLVCQATCIPGKAELEISRDVATHSGKPAVQTPEAALYNRFVTQLPKPLPHPFKAFFQPTTADIRLAVDTGREETSAVFFPVDRGILDNPAAQRLTPTPRGFVLDLRKDAGLTDNPAELKGVLELAGGRAYEIAALPGVVKGVPAVADEPDAPTASNSATGAAVSVAPAAGRAAAASSLSLFSAAGLAFLGGLLLNLMPCVFPVLFLKGLALVQSGNEERHKLRAHGFVYTLGILVSFWVLVGVLLGLRAAGASLGWGFQFQSPVFLALMAGLLFFLGLSLAGQFEIGLTLTGAGGSLVTKDGAAKQGYSGSFFTGVLAVIVATPCTAPLMGAAVGYALAQTAAVTFAVFTALALGLAAPYVALTLQPAWTRLLPRPGAWMDVLKQAISVPIFATVIWLAWVLAQAYGAALLAALLGCFLLLAIAGWFLGRWPARRWATVVAAVIVAAVIAVSALAPGKFGAASQTSVATEKQGWEPWSAETVARYQSQGRPVFVDFTASWCLSCQVNERVALSQTQVQKAFADANVALLRADWTRHDEAITQALTALGRDGVPAYALYAPGNSNPQMLPEVLTPGIVTDALGTLPRNANQSNARASALK
jgi:thiol:disulfide interchange protein/DsbC/DsbD-like thiol-disulfide interchange protein